jgi:hypothetical protein
MMLAHGEVVLTFWLKVALLIFGLPLLFLLFYKEKLYALPVAFATVCVGISVLLLYLMFARR